MPALLAQIAVPRDPIAIGYALEGLVALDSYLIDKHRLPHIRQSGAVYKREKHEDWRSALEVVHEGWGDCEDLASYHAAWLRVHRGEPARVLLKWTGPKTMHCVVQRYDGSIDDPSLWLGMKG